MAPAASPFLLSRCADRSPFWEGSSALALLLASQRTAVVSKTALSHCENIASFGNVEHTGLDYRETLAGPQVGQLGPRQGEAVASGPPFSADNPVVITVFESGESTALH